MITRRIAIFAALSVAFYPVLPALPASDPDLLAALDTNHDGTVSLDEAKKAAELMFDKLDRDHDGTLTRRELRGRLSAKEFAAADTDKDGTISKDGLTLRLGSCGRSRTRAVKVRAAPSFLPARDRLQEPR